MKHKNTAIIDKMKGESLDIAKQRQQALINEEGENENRDVNIEFKTV